MLFVWLTVSAPADATVADAASMWSCALTGERRSSLFLADRGARSYVQFSGKRIPAQLSVSGSERRWTFGSNFILLTPDGRADYHEHGTLKARFRCEAMESN